MAPEAPRWTAAPILPSKEDRGVEGGEVADAWWKPGSGTSRVFFLARADASCTAELSSQMDLHGVLALLGVDIFPFENLHQSLSDRYRDTPDIRRRLLLAGGNVQVQAFTLALSRLQCAPNDRGSCNVDVRMHRASEGLDALVDAINAAVAGQGLPKGGRHTAHVTLSYGFRGVMPRTQTIPAIDLSIDAFELVVGGGTPYGYTTLGRWNLDPAAPRAVQSPLF